AGGETANGSSARARRSTRLISWPMALLIGLMLVSTPGCGGCRSNSTAQQQRAEDDKERAGRDRDGESPYEVEPAAIQPVDAQSPTLAIKPGHWASAVKQLKS